MVEALGYLLNENKNISVVVSARAVFTDLTLIVVDFLIKEPRPILLNLGNLMISIGYTSQHLSFLMSLKIRKLTAKI
jgi:hypothetical protein